jgi:HEAT repeat protein
MKRASFLTFLLAAALAVPLPAQTRVPATSLSEDEQMKMFAIDSLMNTQSERALPLLEKLIVAPATSPALKRRAVQAIAMNRSAQSTESLSRIYGASTTDEAVKRELLRGWMASGRKDALLKAAQSEPSVSLRKEAVRLLGASGAPDSLADIYRADRSAEVREEALRAMGARGDFPQLLAIAKTETDEKLRHKAITFLGHNKSTATEQALTELYDSSKDAGSRKAVLRALMMQGNAKALVAIARKETSPELKREAVSCLGHMRSTDATDYLMELLGQ